MMHSLELQVNSRPEVLERVLRVIRHRGFNVTNMQMEAQGPTNVLVMQVASDRAIHLLTTQLQKLPDVNDCQVAQ